MVSGSQVSGPSAQGPGGGGHWGPTIGLVGALVEAEVVVYDVE